MLFEVIRNKVTSFLKEYEVIENAELEAFRKALETYNQAENNFRYAEDMYVEKSIYDLKSARVHLNNTLKSIRGDKFERNKPTYSKSN